MPSDPPASDAATEQPAANARGAITLAFASAPIAQSEDGVDGLVPATAQVSPPEEGEVVVLQQLEGDAWEDAASAAQDAEGGVSFAVDVPPADTAMLFRAVLLNNKGGVAAKSEAVRVRIGLPVFNDEFDGDELDAQTWEHRQVGVRNAEGDRPCAESAVSSVDVADGTVQLSVSEIDADHATQDPQPGQCPYGEFYNGHIGTRGHFSFRYGVMAARIRFPSQQGQHGAFWSQPNKGGGAEIDVIEYFGDEFPARPDNERGVPAGSNAVQHSVYWEEPEGQQHKAGGLFDVSHLLPEGETWADDFHVYSAEWTPQEYIFRIDGHETFRTSEGLSDVQQYLILSLLTSNWELPRFDPENAGSMQVDWVRVWRPPATTKPAD